MGWSYVYKPDCENLKSFVTRQINSDDLKVIHCAARGNTVYAAVAHTKENYIFGVVTLLKKSKGDNRLGCKFVTEDMGPYESQCPKYIIDALTPTNNYYSVEWRKACLEKRTPNYKENTNV